MAKTFGAGCGWQKRGIGALAEAVADVLRRSEVDVDRAGAEPGRFCAVLRTEGHGYG